jgi:hypothetical protein
MPGLFDKGWRRVQSRPGQQVSEPSDRARSTSQLLYRTGVRSEWYRVLSCRGSAMGWQGLVPALGPGVRSQSRIAGVERREVI